MTAAGAAGLLCLGTLSGTVGASAAGAATGGRTILAGSVVTAKARQHPVGAVSKSTGVDFDLVLKLRDAAGATALLRAVSTPGSTSYRHYLTTAQWESRFSPSAKAVNTARAWLRSQGFKVGAVSGDHITISASGTAAQVEKAFGTGLGYYKVAGHTVRLATKSMSVPASIAGSVAGAMGINQSVAIPATSAAGATSAGRKFPAPPPLDLAAPPCGTYYGQSKTTVTPPFGHGYPRTVPDTVCGYKPPQFRSAYHLSSSGGKGATVAIVDAYGSATIAGDATRYFRMNDPGNPFAKAHFTQIHAFPFTNQTLCGASGWLPEQAIDIESVHSTAPNAHILFVGAKSCLNTDLMAADQKIVDHHLADVVSNSWGDPSGDILDDAAYRTAFDDVFKMGGSTGITIQFSSGDDGDNFVATGLSAPSYPASSPYVTGVGGTSLKIGANGQQTGDLGWSTGRSFKCTANGVGILPGCTKSTVGTWGPVGYDGGSGGYTSYSYTQPSYQKGVVPSSLAQRNAAAIGSSTPMRVVPDISMDADPSTGLLTGYTQTFPNGKTGYSQFRWGGTSLASPLLAGVVADADAVAMAHGGAALGFINPLIYRLHANSGAIQDIVPGGKQGQFRRDYASLIVSGLKGYFDSFRELTYEGPITYCDGTGNCATRPNTLSTAKGYDSMTGLGSIGPKFVADLAKS